MLLTLVRLAFAQGVYGGAGITIEIHGDAKVQVLEEQVLIRPGRGRIAFDGSIEGLDVTRFRAKYRLKSLEPEAADVRVRLLSNAQLSVDPGCVLIQGGRRTPARLSAHGSVDYLKDDPLLWDVYGFCDWLVALAPQATTRLDVQYELPISASEWWTVLDIATLCSDPPEGIDEQDWPFGVEDQPPTHLAASHCALEFLDYVLRPDGIPGRKVNRAEVRVELNEFEKYLLERGTWSDSSDEDGGRIFPCETPCIFRRLAPDGWKAYERGVVWEFPNGYDQARRLWVVYYLANIPVVEDDLKPWIQAVLGGRPNPSGLLFLRDVVGALIGTEPRRDEARTFLERQLWYGADAVLEGPLLIKPEQIKGTLEVLDGLIAGEMPSGARE
jgi:hypothetical protein